ncbi:hypothetical protein FZW96_13555 [Bacillus sp. BGMRC 2118]|nr:hypothetical protein FZW96_13555 [Bacillus sp. BGMRC 2118]
MGKSEIKIFWNNIGREHGGVSYVKDIRKNSDAIKSKSIRENIQYVNTVVNGNRFFKHDENTLIEIQPEGSPYSFIIVYCIREGIQYSLYHKKRYNWWLIDIIDVEELEDEIYCVHDLFIDISVEKDGLYRVLDMDEFYFAFQNEIISPEHFEKAMKSYIYILENLNQQSLPFSWLENLYEHYTKKEG